MSLARIALADSWVERDLLINVRDGAGLARPVRLLLDHLVAQPAGQPAEKRLISRLVKARLANQPFRCEAVLSTMVRYGC